MGVQLAPKRESLSGKEGELYEGGFVKIGVFN